MLEMEALRERLLRWRERAANAGDDRQRAECENIARQYESLMAMMQAGPRSPTAPY